MQLLILKFSLFKEFENKKAIIIKFLKNLKLYYKLIKTKVKLKLFKKD